jgi:transcriptional regulator with XRE-family HTH domain
MQGYTIRIAQGIKEADGNLMGVKLGRVCLAQDIPVSTVAEALGVTRQTIYYWFLGRSEPRGPACESIEAYIANLA